MPVKQISVFLENKSGRLAAVTRTLAAAQINIRALSIADTSDFGILRLIVDKPDRAFSALQEGGYTVSQTDVIAVEMPDRPGGLAGVLALLEQAQINVEYLYAFIGKGSNGALLIFRVEEIEEAQSQLNQAGFRVLEGEALYSL